MSKISNRIKDRLNWRRLLKYTFRGALFGVLALLVIREIGVAYNPFPCELIENQAHAKIIRDRQGNIVWASTNTDQNWQMPVPLQEVSPLVIDALLAAEDSRFYSHDGIDTVAIFRAGLSALWHRRITSGASTLTMQLVKMAHLKKKSFSYKFVQMCEATSLERQRSKEWILERYLNQAPYGGNIHGIEAAARFYFRKKALDLNLYEASLLAGLPQGPSRLRPDRYPDRAHKRQQYVLQKMLEQGTILEIPDCPLYLPLEQREKDCRLGFVQEEKELVGMVTKYGDVQTTIDGELQSRMRQLLVKHVKQFQGVDNGALVLIDNKTSEIRSIIGMVQPPSQVNAALRRRSSGSVLKPFIYLSLLEQGRISPMTQVKDSPLNINGYRVRNFTNTFSGSVTVQKALTSSLNVPAVRALQRVGVDDFLKTLSTCGFSTFDRRDYGLSLALGGGEVNLLELTNAYSGLARLGTFQPAKIVSGTGTSSQLFDSGAVALLNQMMSSRALGPRTQGRLCWKTGTSNGFRDAWCVAYNDEYTLGIWLGNEDGRACRSLIGSVAARPLVLKVFNELYPNGLPSRRETVELSKLRVCRESGLQLLETCSESIETSMAPTRPLAFCRQCLKKVNKSPTYVTKITSPEGGSYQSTGLVRLELKSEQEGFWFINGKFIRQGEGWYDFREGNYRVKLVVGDTVDEIKFTIKN